GAAFNYDVTVVPTPTISSASTGSVCSGIAQSYSITSVVPSSYVWSRATVTGISNAVATAQTANPIIETLTNTTNAAVVVRYIITPTSTAGSCPGTAFNYDVTVVPTPTISSASTGIVCSGAAQSYSITSVVPSSYVWSRATVTGISNAVATAQTANPIIETLTNTTNAAVVVRYIITPTSTAGSCPGAAFNYDVTVNPKPTISSAAAGSVCSGAAQSYSITSVVPSSYAWSRAAVTGVSNATVSAQTANPIIETLTNTTNAAVVVRYIITPTSTTGTCAGAAFNYDVTVVPTPTISSLATGSICSGAAQSYAITSVVPSSYAWTRAVVAGISNAIGSGAASPITETLTNTTAASVVVRYIITPTSTAGSCPGTPFNYDVTVIPKPTINSAATGTICTAVAQNYIITSDNPSTYTWTRAAISTINGNVAGSGTSSPITEVLTSTATGPVVVRYVIIPTSTTGGCPGPAFNYDVTVSATAAPTVVIVATPSLTICDGDNISLKANPTSGGTIPAYKWTSSEPTHSGTLSATDTYASTGFKNGEVITVELTSDLGCAVPKTATTTATIVVNPIPVPTVSIVVDDADKTICPNGTLIFTATPVEGGTPPAYVWKRKPLVGPAVTVGTNSNTYTTTTAVDGDIYTVEMLSSEKCAPTIPSISNPITITVIPVPVLNVTIVADQTTICSGNTVNFTATPTGSGSTPAPKYEWFIGAAGSETSQGAATTTNPFSTTSLTTTAALSPQVYSIYVKALSAAECASTTASLSPAITVTVNAGVAGGTITTAKLTICNNTTPGAITAGTTPASGGTTPVYTWQESIDGGAFVTANGTVNGTGFTPSGAKTGTSVSYKRIVTFTDVPSLCNKSESNIINITVLPALVAGKIGDDEGICINTAPKEMKEIALGATTGGAGSGYTYQWQYDAGLGFTDIALATNATYTSPAISVTTKFQRVDKSGTCDAVTTNIVTKTISPKEIITLTPFTAPVDLCVSATPTVFTAVASSDVPTSTLTYAWTLNGDPVGTNSDTYSYTPVIGNDNVTTKVIKVVVSTSNSCNTGDKESSFTVNLKTAVAPTVTISTPRNPLCEEFPTTFTAVAKDAGTPTYQWWLIPSSSGIPGQVGTNSPSYVSPTLLTQLGDQVYVEVTSSLGCALAPNPAQSNKITMDVRPKTTPNVIEPNTEICAPLGFTFSTVETTGNKYQWYKNGTAINNATNATFTAKESGLYSVEEKNAACGSSSLAKELKVIAKPIAYAGPDQSLPEGVISALSGSGGGTYEWTPTTYLSLGTVSNPTFKATQTITYELIVKDGICPSDPDYVTIYVVKPIKVPNVITVNGDGVNDVWKIENIEGYPNVIIEIYNRWGNLVWKTAGYPKNWDGTNYRNSEVLPEGTYFYIINLQSQVYPEPNTGWVQIVK
ncbi:PKD-like domain-containing protein, partial [uncultured Cytophaga sp.]|uniref:PKD-like domain-containing protein n=1 Tax=uncultured Cytophaga sp. TaxID=160238 RepID=UPI00261E3868